MSLVGTFPWMAPEVTLLPDFVVFNSFVVFYDFLFCCACKFVSGVDL